MQSTQYYGKLAVLHLHALPSLLMTVFITQLLFSISNLLFVLLYLKTVQLRNYNYPVWGGMQRKDRQYKFWGVETVFKNNRQQTESIKRTSALKGEGDWPERLMYKQQLLQHTLVTYKIKVHTSNMYLPIQLEDTIFQYIALILHVFHTGKLILLPLDRKIFFFK